MRIPGRGALSEPIVTGLSSPFAGAPLGRIVPQDEYLHETAPGGHHSATETSYFGFNIPEHRLDAEIYMWFHPALKTMSASVYIWRGFNASTLECDYVNHYHYLPFPDAGIADYTIPDIGLRIKVIEPLTSVRIDFADEARGVSFDVRFDAIMPPGGRPNSKHFTQAMKTRGSLDLYGETFTIDGYFSRDHSWGEERRETSHLTPPFSWMVGVIDETFAFHVTATDSPEENPEWTSRYRVESGHNLRWGYVFRDGELFPVTRARKLTLRERDGLTPRLVELEIDDAGGATHAFRGEVMASMPWQTWQNMNVFFCLTRWQSERGVGWGDTQDIQFNDFVRHFAR
jgi:hypothetical protein